MAEDEGATQVTVCPGTTLLCASNAVAANVTVSPIRMPKEIGVTATRDTGPGGAAFTVNALVVALASAGPVAVPS
jgi:hypothetical protein